MLVFNFINVQIQFRKLLNSSHKDFNPKTFQSAMHITRFEPLIVCLFIVYRHISLVRRLMLSTVEIKQIKQIKYDLRLRVIFRAAGPCSE